MSSPSQTRNLYSLSDQPLVCELGQLGPYIIDAKPKDAPYGVTVIEPRTTLMDKGADEFVPHVTSATTIAEDIIYRYPGNGLFLAQDDAKPSTAELAQANKEFELADGVCITQANAAWDTNKDRSKIPNFKRAREAARRRHQVVEWASEAMVELKNCPYCGELVRATAAKCRHCQEWLDASKRPGAANVPQAPPVDADGNDSEFARESAAAMKRLAGAKR